MSHPAALPARQESGDRVARILLGLAAVAVAFAAADTYVVVLALPDMMGAAGLSADQLQRAAPIISGFLLGYVAILPLVGRIADLRGRLPVLVGSLVIFALGSLVTAAGYDLTSIVAGRFLQGLGGGGLVPATLALVADLYPPHRRGIPLGVVGAVQELGSVLGPLYGAVVLSVGSWRAIFWINLAVGLVLVAAFRALARRSGDAATHAPSTVAATTSSGSSSGSSSGKTSGGTRLRDPIGAAAALLGLGCVLMVMIQPRALVTDVDYGLLFLPVAGTGRWLSPLALAGGALGVLFVLRCATARRPWIDLRSWGSTIGQVDVPGAALLSIMLGGVVLAFATADPEVQVFSPIGPYLLLLSALAAVGFAARNRVAVHPLVPRRALRAAPAWGSMVVSFFVGAALIAALVDIPIFARVAVYNDDQLGAALVLVRFLAALPVGALLGGWLTHRIPAGVVTAVGMACSGVGFLVMSRWGLESLDSVVAATIPLVLAGFGFGLALAPVNAALLASTSDDVHGVASALLVVARMVGMLVGISVLTTLGLRQYYAEQTDLPSPMEVCGEGLSRCAAFSRILQEASLVEFQAIFFGAAISSLIAGGLALVLFARADTRETRAPVLGSAG